MEVFAVLQTSPTSRLKKSRILTSAFLLIVCLGFLLQTVNATTETRYLQKEGWDGTYFAQLRTDQDETTFQTASYEYAQYSRNASWGIRVYINNTASKLEYRELTSGTPVAIVSRTATNTVYGAQSATWACPESPLLNATDALVVKWYVILYRINDLGNSGWQELSSARSRTEALGANYINSSLWSITYYTRFVNLTGTPPSVSARIAYDGNSDSGDYYPMKIANFIWNPIPASGTNLTVSGLISLTFTLANTRALAFSRAGTIPLAFAVSNGRSINIKTEGTIPLSFSIINERSVAWNLFSLIPLSLSVSNKRIIVWNLPGTIPLTFSFDGFIVQNPYTVLLNIFGIIPLTFTIVTVTTLPSVDQTPILFIGVLTCAILVGLCIVMMRRRKQN